MTITSEFLHYLIKSIKQCRYYHNNILKTI